MLVKDLKRGMILEFKAGFIGLMVNDTSAVTWSDGGYSKSMLGEVLDSGAYPVIAVYEIDQLSSLQADIKHWLRDKKILERCSSIWNSNSETVMSIRELEEKYGIKNLKIKAD